MEDRLDFYGAWSNGEPKEDENMSEEKKTCVLIDPRGINDALFTESCDVVKSSFICEYKKVPDSCNSTYPFSLTNDFNNVHFVNNSNTVNDDGNMNPPLSQCSDNSLDSTTYSHADDIFDADEEIKNITSDQVYFIKL